MTNTRDFSDLGSRERSLLCDILEAWTVNGLPDDFDNEGVVWEFNPVSGHVFLVNANFDCCMCLDGKLESWYYCHECGNEGFKQDCELNDEGCSQCSPLMAFTQS